MNQSKTVLLQLYIVRHGQTESNIKQILAGQNQDALTPLGIKQAQLLGQRLIQENTKNNFQFDYIYVSDLKRTIQTFEQTGQKVSPIMEPLIREKAAGKLEGKPLSVPMQMAKQQNLTIREFRPDQGENWIDVNGRARKFLQKLYQQMDGNKLQKILLVTHGGWIMELLNVYEEVKNKKKAIFDNSIQNCSLTILEVKMKSEKIEEIEFKLILRNDNSHIK